MELIAKDYVKGDYEKYIKSLTKTNMCQLFKKNFGGWSDETSEKKFFEVLKNGFVKLFFIENTFVGYVSYNSEKNNDKSYLINDIHIVSEFQGKGYGTQILNFVLNEAIKANIEQLKVFVFENNPAVKFYEKNGFKEIEHLDKTKTFIMIRLVKN